MKKTKWYRLLLIILTAFAAAFACLFIINGRKYEVANAADETSVDLVLNYSAETVGIGVEFTVDVGIKNRPGGIMAVMFTLDYNANSFEYLSSTKGSTNTFGKDNSNYDTAGKLKINCSFDDDSYITGDIDLFTFKFKVKDGTAAGTEKISVNATDTIEILYPIETFPYAADATFNYDASGYSITIRQASNDATLSSVTVNGGATTLSDSTFTLNSNLTYAQSLNSVNIVATATDGGATVSGTGNQKLTFTDNRATVTLTVTAEDGTTTKTYTVVINRTAAATDKTLKAVKLTKSGSADRSGTISGATITFGEIAYAEKDGWTLAAEANSSLATISGTGAITLTGGTTNTFTITVTAEDGNSQNYTVNIPVVAANTDTGVTLKLYNGTTQIDASASGTSYTAKVNGSVSSLDLTVEKTSSLTTVKVEVGGSVISEVNGKYAVTLSGSVTNVTVTATAESGATATYSIAITRQSSEAAATVEVYDGTKLTLTGNAVTVPYATEKVTVLVTGVSTGATATVNGATPAALGNEITLTAGVANTVTVVITAEDGTQNTINLSITRTAAATDKTLKAVKLTKSGATDISGTISGTTITFGEIAYAEKDGWTLAAEANSSLATISGTGLITLTGGTNTFTITVTAEDGSSQNYTVNIPVVAANTNTSLTLALSKTDGTSVTMNGGGNIYSVKVANSVTELNLTVTKASETTAVEVKANDTAVTEVDGKYAITLGTNGVSVSIVATAEDGTTAAYSIAITRLSNANTATVEVYDGITKLTLTNDAVTVPYATEKVTVLVTGVSTGATATVNGATPAALGNEITLTAGVANTVAVVITAEDGTQNSINLSITRTAAATDKTLKVVKLTKSGATDVSGTISGTTITFGEIAYAEKDGWTLAAEANSSLATISGTGLITLTGGTNTFTVTVTAEDGSSQAYTVNIPVVAADTNTSLTLALSKTDGTPVTMNGGGNIYSVKVANSVTALNLTVTKASETTAVEVKANDTAVTEVDGKYAITLGTNGVSVSIVATAEDGATAAYSIAITRLSNANTATVEVYDGATKLTLTGNAVTVPYATEKVTVKVTDLAATATATVNDAEYNASTGNEVSLQVGANTVTVRVTPEDTEAVNTYTITITRNEAVQNADLDSLVLSGVDGVTATREGNVYTVSATLAYAQRNSLTVTATAGDANAKVKIGDDGEELGSSERLLQLTGGENVITITVTAQAGGSNSYTLIVNVEAASANADLDGDIEVYNGEEKLTGLKKNNIASTPLNASYILSYSDTVTALKVTATAADAKATVKVEALSESGTMLREYETGEAIELTASVAHIRITVTAEDGVTVKTHSIALVPISSSGGDSPVPDQKFITVNIGSGEETIEISKGNSESKVEVSEDATGFEFSLTVIDGVTVDVVYGATKIDEEAQASTFALAVYAEEVIGGVRYYVDLADGSKTVILRATEGLGDETFYALNIVKPSAEIVSEQPASGNNRLVWMILFIIFLVLFVLAVAALILTIRWKHTGGGDDGTAVLAEVAPVEYTVKFEMNGHGKQVKKCRTVDGLLTEPEAPVADGYVFGGWYTDAECTQKFAFGEAVEQDLKVYAQWTEEPKPEPIKEEEPVEEPVAEEAPAEEERLAQEEQPVEEETEGAFAQEEEPVEEPVEEGKPTEEEKPVEEGKPTEEVKQEEQDGQENTFGGVQINRVQTHREKYESLSHEQKVFYDELKLRAMASPGAVLNENKANETIRIGQKRILKLTIRREYVVACFFAENKNVTDLKRAMRGKNIRINTKETEIPIYDVRAFEAAEEMLQIVLDSLFDK